MRKFSLYLATVVAFVAIVAVAASAPGGQPKAKRAAGVTRMPLEIGLQDDDVFLKKNVRYDLETAYQQARTLGVTRLRINVIWGLPDPTATATVIGDAASSPSQPNPIPYNWTPYDNVVNEAAAHGIKVQMTLTAPAPAYGSTKHLPGVVYPSPQAYGRWVTDVAVHFKGRVDRYAIWNEPNYVSWLAPHIRAPALYRALYTAGYKAVKAVDPTAQVLIGETSSLGSGHNALAPLAFLRQLTCSKDDYTPRGHCRPLVADGYAHHPYSGALPPLGLGTGPNDVTTGSLSRLSDALAKLAARGALKTPQGGTLPIFLTEYGVYTRGKRAVPPLYWGSYETLAFELAQRAPSVREMTQFGLVPPALGFAFDTALLDSMGQPRTLFTALQSFVARRAQTGKVVLPHGPITFPLTGPSSASKQAPKR